VPSFLVEVYIPCSLEDARETARQLCSAADELARAGTPVRYLRTTFVPDDETCFHVLEAPGRDAVTELSRRAGLDRARIVPAFEEFAS
jgi:hypothetical protein